jgi:type VI secretion system protein VasJ
MPVVAQVPAQHITGLLAPIDPAVPAGLFDVEDETYQAIDQEMVKLGGLQEASIDWVYIEEASRLYLSQQCKHLRIVSHLSVAWLRSGCWERWGYTLALLAGMVEHYWEPAHPKPGPKGFLGKRKLAALMLNRLIEALPRLDRFTYTPAHAAAAQQALTCLQQQQGVAQLDASLLGDLQRLLGNTRRLPTASASLLRPRRLRQALMLRRWPKSSPRPCRVCRWATNERHGGPC